MKNGDNCAFPAKSDWHTDGGLTKREYFAGLAVQGFISGNYEYLHENHPVPIPSEIVKRSIEIADELLKQLES